MRQRKQSRKGADGGIYKNKLPVVNYYMFGHLFWSLYLLFWLGEAIGFPKNQII